MDIEQKVTATMSNFNTSKSDAISIIGGILYMLERGNKIGARDRKQFHYHYYNSGEYLDGMDSMGASDAQYDLYSLIGEGIFEGVIPIKDYNELKLYIENYTA